MHVIMHTEQSCYVHEKGCIPCKLCWDRQLLTPSNSMQGYGLGRYDILFATNVLHATRNMAKTLQQCKTLLRNGGLLIANELSAKTPFLSLTFGLTEGWWLYDDESRRIPGTHHCRCCLKVRVLQPVDLLPFLIDLARHTVLPCQLVRQHVWRQQVDNQCITGQFRLVFYNS